MSTWTVVNRLTGEAVYTYTSDTPTEWLGMEYSAFNHIKLPEVVGPAPVARRGVTKQQFFDLLGVAAVTWILTAAKTDVNIESWVKRLDLTTPDPDGTSVDLNDERTIAGVNAMGSAMSGYNIVPKTWATEVLSGTGI